MSIWSIFRGENQDPMKGWSRDSRLVGPSYDFHEVATFVPSGITIIQLDVLGRWSDDGLAELQRSAKVLLPGRHRWVQTAHSQKTVGRAALAVYAGRQEDIHRDEVATERQILTVLHRTLAVALAGSSWERPDGMRLGTSSHHAIDVPEDAFVTEALNRAEEALRDHPIIFCSGSYPDYDNNGWYTWRRSGASDRAREFLEHKFEAHERGEFSTLSKEELEKCFNEALRFRW